MFRLLFFSLADVWDETPWKELRQPSAMQELFIVKIRTIEPTKMKRLNVADCNWNTTPNIQHWLSTSQPTAVVKSSAHLILFFLLLFLLLLIFLLLLLISSKTYLFIRDWIFIIFGKWLKVERKLKMGRSARRQRRRAAEWKTVAPKRHPRAPSNYSIFNLQNHLISNAISMQTFLHAHC